mmetsp:Transcript_28510/g.71200  ORF Transcript_28510/g.71200 Transcript_28510/m.71200 type:complete len:274 (+) Transcript_28510:792-1613(+)
MRLRPRLTQHLSEFLEALRCCVAYREDRVLERLSVHLTHLLLEDVHTQVLCEDGYVVQHSLPHTPLLVSRQLYHSRQQRLVEILDSHDICDFVHTGQDAKTDLRNLVPEECDDDWHQVFEGQVLLEDRCQLQHGRRQRTSDEAGLVGDQFVEGLDGAPERRPPLPLGKPPEDVDQFGRRDGAHLMLLVFEQRYVLGNDELAHLVDPVCTALSHCIRQLFEVVSCHVPNPPRLVHCGRFDDRSDECVEFLGQLAGHRDAVPHHKQTHRIVVVDG